MSLLWSQEFAPREICDFLFVFLHINSFVERRGFVPGWIYDFLLAFLHIYIFFRNGVYPKSKEIAPGVFVISLLYSCTWISFWKRIYSKRKESAPDGFVTSHVYSYTWISSGKVSTLKVMNLPPRKLSEDLWLLISLRKQAYSNILKILPPKKKWKFSDKNSDIFFISAQNKDCGYSLEPPRRGGSNEYPQSMFLSRNKKNKVCPCKTPVLLYKNGV